LRDFKGTRILALLVVVGLALAPAAWAAGTPSVTVANQEVTSDSVTVAQIVSNGPGWIVIHKEVGGGPGPVVGYAPVKDGTNTNVIVKIDTYTATPRLFAMLHTDAGTIGTYEFPGPDVPVMVDEKMVSPAFSSTALAVSMKAPVIDGIVNPDEYSYTKDFGPLSLSVNRTADTLSLAVVGVTTGWVGVGTGSQKMNGATIFIGFVDKDGKVQFKPQAGSGHTHQDTAQEVSSSIRTYAMTEAGGKTTLEISLKADAYLKKGQDALDLIFAVGAEDSFSPHHSYRNFMSLKLAQ